MLVNCIPHWFVVSDRLSYDDLTRLRGLPRGEPVKIVLYSEDPCSVSDMDLYRTEVMTAEDAIRLFGVEA